MNFRIISIVLMAVFYGIYLYKLISLNKQNIKTNQAGIGDKSKKVIITEKIMSLSNVLVIIAQVLSVILVDSGLPDFARYGGAVIGVISVVFFAMATYTMKNSWRVGIPEEKTTLINTGIYKWSRNPAFVGFDLLYISNCIMFFNIPLAIMAALAMIMLHLQVLQEEAFMKETFGDEYIEYCEGTCRYFGKKKVK